MTAEMRRLAVAKVAHDVNLGVVSFARASASEGLLYRITGIDAEFHLDSIDGGLEYVPVASTLKAVGCAPPAVESQRPVRRIWSFVERLFL